MDDTFGFDIADRPLIAAIGAQFLRFAEILRPEISGPWNMAYPPATEEHIAKAEGYAEAPLPESYKTFLRITCGLYAFGGNLRIEDIPWEHPAGSIAAGMLCFADYNRKSDGDQVMFDISAGLVDGEYPVYYYYHEEPSLTKVADSFKEFLESYVTGDDR